MRGIRNLLFLTSEERYAKGKNSPEWQDVSKVLIDHTGLAYENLSPNVEWLTANHY